MGLSFDLYPKAKIEPVCGVMLIKKHGKKSVFSLVFYDKRKRIAQMKQGKSLLPAEATTLHSSLLARLDRLGDAKKYGANRAAIGREFGHELLAAVADKSEIELSTALDRLVQAGLVFRQGAPPDGAYLFKHALVQDTAYGTLLREQRRAQHARIVEVFKTPVRGNC